jgi:hypothetical protein
MTSQPTEDESGAMVIAMICDKLAASPKAGQRFFDTLSDSDRQEIATVWHEGKALAKRQK